MPAFLTANLTEVLNKDKSLTEAGPAFKAQGLKDILSRTKEAAASDTVKPDTMGSAAPKNPTFKSISIKDILNRTARSAEESSEPGEETTTVKSPSFKSANLASILRREPGMVSEEDPDTEPATIKSPNFKGANLDTILNRKPGDVTEDTVEEEDNELVSTAEEEEEATVLDPNLDWRQELDDRLAENEEATGSKRKSQEEVQKGFWNDFFVTFWSKELIKPLHALGVQFKLDILKRGFRAQDNDLLAFLQQEGIKNNILKNKLLKEQTYAVLHNATIGGVTTRKLRTAELVEPNKYNLIYNADWYRLKPTEMVKYLELQQKVLTSSLSIKQKEKANRLIFLVDAQIKNKTTSISEYAKEVAAKLGQSRARIPYMQLAKSVALNSFTDATRIAQSLGIVGEDYKPEIEIEEEKAKKTTTMGTKNANSIFSAIHSIADIHFATEKLFDYTHAPDLLDFSSRILSKYPKNKKEKVSDEIKDKMTRILQNKNSRFEIDFDTLIKHFTKKLKELTKK
jgi:hypothetical protein